MHDEDANPILNDIAKAISTKGGTVEVHREGRGFLGVFYEIGQARGSFKYDPVTNQPLPRAVVPEFWCIAHSRGVEMVIDGDYRKLEMRKVKHNVFYLIVPK